MARIMEQFVSGIWEVLAGADQRFTAYQQKRRGEMRLERAIRAEIEAAIAARADARSRNTAAPAVAGTAVLIRAMAPTSRRTPKL